MHCMICGFATERFVDQLLEIPTYRCSQCGVIFKDPAMSHQSFVIQKQRYDLHDNTPNDAGYRRYFRQFLDFVLSEVEMPATALDFGCGKSTLLSDMMEEKGIESRVYDPIYHPDGNYQDQTYDLITSVEVFEHLHHPLSVFQELVALLTSRGVLAIRTEFAPASIEAYLQWYYRKDPTHVVFFTPVTFRTMCQKAEVNYLLDNGKNIAVVSRS